MKKSIKLNNLIQGLFGFSRQTTPRNEGRPKSRLKISRDIPVGNSRLLVCFDQDDNLRELYFPHVGQENQVNGNFCCKIR
jgi:hypothetical protein